MALLACELDAGRWISCAALETFKNEYTAIWIGSYLHYCTNVQPDIS